MTRESLTLQGAEAGAPTAGAAVSTGAAVEAVEAAVEQGVAGDRGQQQPLLLLLL